MVLVVASYAAALAPFSQNSAPLRWVASGHAQLGQSKPAAWLSWASTFGVRRAHLTQREGGGDLDRLEPGRHGFGRPHA